MVLLFGTLLGDWVLDIIVFCMHTVAYSGDLNQGREYDNNCLQSVKTVRLSGAILTAAFQISHIQQNS